MKKLTIKDLTNMVDALCGRIEDLEKANIALVSTSSRDRGPVSTRKMTEDDARRLVLGDLVDLSHKEAAEDLGLSYAQVYSCRGGYTFKSLQDEARAKK